MNNIYNIKHFSPGILLLLLLACPPAFAIKQQMVYGVKKSAKQFLLPIHTPEGRLIQRTDGTYRYEYTLTDHLGNARVSFTDEDADGTPELLQEDHYYPFGMQMPGLHFAGGGTPENKYLYNSKELLDDEGINLYDYGFRFYDAALGRWHVIDQMAESYYTQSPYQYVMNNPISYIDPDGASTHTDSSGNVVAVYDDNNNSVYRHDELPDDYATYENEAEDIYVDENGEIQYKYKKRLPKGEKMGETEYWDEFRAHDNETGEVKTEVTGKILFNTTWDYSIYLLNKEANELNLFIVGLNSFSYERFDIKKNKIFSPYGEGTGRLLNGKYASARSAGNYLAGINAATGTIFGKHISQKKFMRIAGFVHAGFNKSGNYNTEPPFYGEIPYAGRMILSGFQAGIRKR